MKKILSVVLGSFFIGASLIASVPTEKAQQLAKAAAACKCDSTCCNPCNCTQADACKLKAQKSENAACAQTAAPKETKCCSINK